MGWPALGAFTACMSSNIFEYYKISDDTQHQNPPRTGVSNSCEIAGSH